MKMSRTCLTAAAATCVCGAVALWWWVTWPDRTLTQFLAWLHQENYLQANGMLVPGLAFEPTTEWGIVRIDYKPANRSEFTFSNTLKEKQPERPWLRLRSDQREVIVLPARVWAAWLDRRRITLCPRTWQDVLTARLRFEALDGNQSWVVRRNAILLEEGKHFAHFYRERFAAAIISRGGMTFEVETVVGEDDELRILGPKG